MLGGQILLLSVSIINTSNANLSLYENTFHRIFSCHSVIGSVRKMGILSGRWSSSSRPSGITGSHPHKLHLQQSSKDELAHPIDAQSSKFTVLNVLQRFLCTERSF